MDYISELVAIRDEIKADIKTIKIMIDQFKSDYNNMRLTKDNEAAKIFSNLLKQVGNETKSEANFSKNNRQMFSQLANVISKYS